MAIWRDSNDVSMTFTIIVHGASNLAKCTNCPLCDNICLAWLNEGSNCRSRSCPQRRSQGTTLTDGEKVTTSMKPNNASGTTLGSVAADAPAEQPSLADLRHHESFPADRPAVPVFFLSDSTGISAETMGNALLIQFPELRFERRLIPFITSVEEARRVVAILDAAAGRPGHPAGLHHRGGRRDPRASCTDPVPDHRLLRAAHGAGRVHPRGPGIAGRRTAARGRRHQALQRADGGGGVRHRARRRPEPARAGQGRRDLGRPVALRQDPDDDVPGACSTASSSPTTRWSTRTSRSTELPRPVQAPARPCFGLITTPARLQPGAAGAPAQLPLRLPRAVHATSCAGPRPCTPHRMPIINSSTKSVEEMSTVILQTLSHQALTDEETSTISSRERNVVVVRRSRAGRSRAGRRQERLPGRDGQQPGVSRRPGAGRVRHHRDAYRRFIADDRAGRADHRASWRAWTPTTSRAARRGGPAGSATAVRRAAVPSRTWRPTSARPTRSWPGTTSEVSFAVRSSATAEDLPGRLVRRPAGDLPQHPRHRGRSCTRSGRCSPRSTTTGPSPTGSTTGSTHDDVALSAGVQRMVRSDIGASGVMFTMDTESGFTDAVFITSSYGLGEAVVQGAVEPGRVLRLQAGPARRPAGDPQARHRRQGDQDGLHRRRRRSARPPSSSTSTEAERRRLSLTDDEVERAGPARAGHRGALRPADGHRVGQGRRRRAALHPPGAPGDGAVAPQRRPRQRYRIERHAGRSWSRGAPSGRRSAPAPCGCCSSVDADARLRPGRGAGRRHDRPRLGADHEAGLRRSSPTAAAGPATPRSSPASSASRPSSAPARRPASWPTGSEVTVSCAEGDTGYVYGGTARLQRRGDRARQRCPTSRSRS